MAKNSSKNIYLTGFMGSGKTTMGAVLAAKIGCRHVDTDEMIQVRAGLVVGEIFTRHGEAYFRRMEEQVLATLAGSRNLVVSTGGGIVQSTRNREILKAGHWIYLRVAFDVIKRRIAASTMRPLALKGDDEMRKLYYRRLPLYQMAEYIVDCDVFSPDFLCQKIVKAIN